MAVDYARRCTSTPFGRHIAASQNPKTKNKRYDVLIDDRGKHTCTCVAFVMKRNKMGGLTAIGTAGLSCKHIDALLAVHGGCGWNSTTGEIPQFETVCPRCYNDTEFYDPRDPDDIDLDELMASFLAMSKKLGK